MINSYRNMWVFTLFDLPVETKKQRKIYAKFRMFLLKEGFSMLQYSVYYRFTNSIESAAVFMKKIEDNLPNEGKVTVMQITDKQFERMKHYWGREKKDSPEEPQQLSLF